MATKFRTGCGGVGINGIVGTRGPYGVARGEMSLRRVKIRLFPDISRPGPFGPEPLMTWDAFETHYAPAFLPHALALRDRYPDPFETREVS